MLSFFMLLAFICY